MVFIYSTARDEVRLPRYLEKQKREKAEAKQLANLQDPDCPVGHVLLSDQDRLTYLTNAQKRELNLPTFVLLRL